MISPCWQSADGRVVLYRGDVRDVLAGMPDGIAQTCVTSPPYWNLRDYGVDGQIGSEKTPQEFVRTMVEVFEGVRRVLQSDGTLWLNLGDSYASGKGSCNNPGGGSNSLEGHANLKESRAYKLHRGNKSDLSIAGLKPKDLVGIPWRVALALQDAGWWLRSDIIWSKPNPMPESCTDRPTKAHEYIFLLTKAAKYYYDADAVKEPARDWGTRDRSNTDICVDGAPGQTPHRGLTNGNNAITGRNRRSVWEIATQSFADAHFATYPEKLVEPCILAVTSERGACAKCGKAWGRIREYKANYGRREPAHAPHSAPSKVDSSEWRPPTVTQLGWQPLCKCACEETEPQTVLDCFNGAGTTGLVALRLGRRYIGIDLNSEYLDMTIKRLEPILAQPALDLEAR